jgi:hypothetical protein
MSDVLRVSAGVMVIAALLIATFMPSKRRQAAISVRPVTGVPVQEVNASR